MSAYQSLLRHFTDLAEGNHGGAQTRAAKEDLFQHEVKLLEPIMTEVLNELSGVLLRGSGVVGFSGVHRTADGSLLARWTLEWAGQRQAGIPPVTLMAYYGRGFHHPHLRAATVGEWPLNLYTAAQAQDEKEVLRAIAASELHNLVFRLGGDVRCIPAVWPAQEETR